MPRKTRIPPRPPTPAPHTGRTCAKSQQRRRGAERVCRSYKVTPATYDAFQRAAAHLGISTSHWVVAVCLRAARDQGFPVPPELREPEPRRTLAARSHLDEAGQQLADRQAAEARIAEHGHVPVTDDGAWCEWCGRRDCACS